MSHVISHVIKYMNMHERHKQIHSGQPRQHMVHEKKNKAAWKGCSSEFAAATLLH